MCQFLCSGTLLYFKLYNLHSNNALKNTCSGTFTIPIGILKPGMPIQTCIFDDSKVSIMEIYDTEDDLCEFRFVLVSIRVRSKDHVIRDMVLQLKK